MTICIAGISEENKIIAVTDKMLTLSQNPVTKYEISENNKAIQISDKCVALFAGDVVVANQILELAKTKGLETGTVAEMAEKVNQAYREYIHLIIDNYLINKYKLTFDVFMANHANLEAEMVRQVTKIITDTNFDVEIIVAGIDEDPHVFFINSLGTIIDKGSSIGYACIGSGSQHATLSLIESEYNSHISLDAGIYALLQAKRRAEFDPGVGKLWDFVLINDSYIQPSAKQVESVTDLYQKSLEEIGKISKKSSTDIIKAILK
ncbi:MAG TPA: hypothetical protein VKC54_00170 [Patescibacteria group bacterium]|nr:hypothetical protein [Patescibacteria group bacterium]